MPLIFKVTHDMFQYSEVMDYMGNATNLVGVMGAGIAAEFRKRCGDKLIEPYRAACRTKELRFGTIQVVEDVDQDWGVFNIPTKDHYMNRSEKTDIVRSLEALRDLLQQDEYRYASLTIPMLSCGLGGQDYPTVLPLMIDYLSDLEATVFLSMSPERTEERPKYLVVVGPPDYGLTDDDKLKIESVLDSVLVKWGMNISDYEGIVSGGYPGVDTFVCGEYFNKDYENTLAYKRTLKRPLVVKPNKVRNGVGSNLLHSNLLCEIADDIILFKPHGHNNNRMSAMQMWLEADKLKREQDGHPPRRIAVFGDNTMTPTQEQLIIPVTRGED